MNKPNDIRQGVIHAANHIRQAELILRRVMQGAFQTHGPYFKISAAWSHTVRAKRHMDRLLDATKEQS